MNVEGIRTRGRSKKRLLNAIKSDMRTAGIICVDDVRDRFKWEVLGHGGRPQMVWM